MTNLIWKRGEKHLYKEVVFNPLECAPDMEGDFHLLGGNYLDGSPFGIVLVDSNYKILFHIDTHTKVYNYELEEDRLV